MREMLLTGNVILKKTYLKILRRKYNERSCNYNNQKLFFCLSLRYEKSFKLHLILAWKPKLKVIFLHEMSFKLHLILAWKPLVFMQIRCNFPDISYLSETQKNNFQFLS